MQMSFNSTKQTAGSAPLTLLCLALLWMALAFPGHTLAAATGQRTFSSPDAAAKALIAALRADDLKALQAIFGPGSEELINSGDAVADRARRAKFLQLYEEKSNITQKGKATELSVGKEDWPFPIPLVQEKDGQWRFDTESGRDEILARRIGKNEWGAIQFCLAYVDAQREYARKDRDGNGLLEYALKFRSTPGQHNGLYWETGEGEEQSPLGPVAAVAQKQGYIMEKDAKPAPFLGYYYRILTGQGKNAPGGAFDYLVNGKLLGGFALVAYPAHYHSTGIMTFLVNYQGQVYQKDLGEKTEETAQAMTVYDPDSSWHKVEDKVANGQ